MDSRLIKPTRLPSKPLLLKDHLLDDMSSCSSNGFKSFPRRQCCTGVRFLHEFDHRSKQKITYVDFKKPPAKSALSSLQSVITAVKRLHFGAAKSPEKKRYSNINSFLPRSFSRKIFKKGGFWKRKPAHKEIERWKPFNQMMEDPEPSNRSCSSITTTDGSKSRSWSGSDFTASSEASSNLPEEKNDVVKMPAEVVCDDNGVGATNDDVSAESTTTTSTNSSNETKQKQWSSDQEKEQFSPVSVLDCPFDDDDDDEVSSPFRHRLARVEGTRKKLLKKIQRFECLAKIEPVNLTTRFGSHLDSDNESSDSHLPHSEEDDVDEEEEEEEDDEEKALELLDQIKGSLTSEGLMNLMLDFFREGIAGEKQGGELVEMAEDWIGGGGVFEEWEVEKRRQAIVEEMERGGEWKILEQEKEEVVLELGNEVFDVLLNELFLDMITS